MQKIFKKTAMISLITIISISLLLVGCGKKATPTESALANFELYQKDNVTENFPGEESDAKKLIEDNKKLSIDYMRKDYGDGEYKGEINEAKLNSLYSKLIEVSRKITPKAEEISQEGDTAIVKLSAKPIDETKYEKIMEEKWDKVSDEEAKDVNKALTLNKEYYDEIIKNTMYMDKEESIEIKMKKDQGYWIIESQKELKKLDKLVFKED